ncbi:DUF5990 family protein [Kitasatospora sp. NPDC093806]|uniref:DUF5990 family protein n=1 Tax=Kitasatospora sp. NPDC093806 TaxID=3155075 RepID=UPI00342A675F
MQIHIQAVDLPGSTCVGGPGFPGYAGVQVAVQGRGRPEVLLDPQPGDAAAAGWVLECRAKPVDGGLDLTGPWIQGGPGRRFVYLVWSGVDDEGAFGMFRRAKLMLDSVDEQVGAAAVRSGVLVARLGLTDVKGHPLCAAVRPPLVEWSAGGAG